MTDKHKAALNEGRSQGRTIRAYLQALEASKPKRGRKRTPESISKRLATIEDTIGEAEPLKRVQLVQEQMNLQSELDRMSQKVDMTDLEEQFVKVAKPYSQKKGITYGAWRAIGVPANVLTRADIGRSG